MLEVKNLKFGYSAMMPVLNDISFQAGNQRLLLSWVQMSRENHNIKNSFGLLKPQRLHNIQWGRYYGHARIRES